MRETRYMISEASKRIDIEQHTLRYWEEELDLHILRNEMGHRYYREEDIEVLKAVKILKEKGYQLRAIKMLLPEIQKLSNLDKEEVEKMQQEWDKKYMDAIVGESNQASLSVHGTRESEQDDIVEKSVNKLEQFKTIMNSLITDAIRDNNDVLSDSVSDVVTKSVIKEMDFLLRMKEEREEERFKQFDRTLRELQNGRAEFAAAKIERLKKKKGIFSKK
ncbi:helix-turn-helix domain-containing protein [Anaerocolumna sp. MB42-C2]|uniref:helix-turn-helix domain-containing protein n=1 Tax=Anaerocolumna sp. MB42-C2 TaxID=3070997 RepID=UPI0027E14AEA|nr:helix-turn-helix domain-containing protein [Anaerocolumna sp. MB42-C2]WMJ85665.1 helix-turn-helix domain-containing protein [Anaerocolumna sp. MB42-C2]